MSNRFAIRQSGNKIRAIGDFSASGVNDACRPVKKLTTQGLGDAISPAAKKVEMEWRAGQMLTVGDEDVSSAHKTLPIQGSHLQYVYASFPGFFGPGVNQLYALPFGAFSPATAWEMVGSIL